MTHAADQTSKTDSPPPGKYIAYVGTYTDGESQGIYSFEFDSATGSVSSLRLAGESENPTFLAIHPNNRILYAANEIGNFRGEKAGGVSAFSIDPNSSQLTLINQESSKGPGPCHLVVDRTGKNVLVANYGGGSLAVLPIGKEGRLGPSTTFIQHEGSSVNPRRQRGPHAHSINLDSGNRFAFAADLGLDKVFVYAFDAKKGTLSLNKKGTAAVAPGSGPRHFAFHPSGRFAYVINELLSTVTVFAYDSKTGSLTELQTISTLPEGFHERSSTAEVQVHRSGRFLFGSNRGHDSIAVFAINQETGKLTLVEHEPTGGKTPRNFVQDPTGNFLLAENQTTNNIFVFRIDQKSGKLSRTGTVIKVPSPVCIKMVPVAR